MACTELGVQAVGLQFKGAVHNFPLCQMRGSKKKKLLREAPAVFMRAGEGVTWRTLSVCSRRALPAVPVCKDGLVAQCVSAYVPVGPVAPHHLGGEATTAKHLLGLQKVHTNNMRLQSPK